jgi:hypothetical protein
MKLHSFVLLAATAVPIDGLAALAKFVLDLDTDRTTYWVGEPVRVTLKVANPGDKGASGFFELWGEETQIYLRRGDETFEGVRSEGRWQLPKFIDKARLPATLKPGQSEEFRDVVVMNARTRDLLLATPGDYEIKVRCWPLLPGLPEPDRNAPESARSGPVLESNAVRIRVEAPPSAQSASLTEYRRHNLALLVQSPMGYSNYDVDVVRRATEFIEAHPHGPYSEHVRTALIPALRHRINKNKATSQEQALYERLLAERVAPR